VPSWVEDDVLIDAADGTEPFDTLVEESTVSFTDCGDILGSAIKGDFSIRPPPPSSWVDNADGTDPSSSRPGWRMREAARDVGLLTEWDDHDDDHRVHP